jgi:hypothetical protein
VTIKETAEEQIRKQLQPEEPQPPKITVVVYRRSDSQPFEARVLQQHTLGPNLSPKTGTADMAKSAAERRLRHDGWKGLIVYEEGFPDTEPVRSSRGLRKHRPSDNLDLPMF